jgi:NAD-dependent dihydropyrimidine dehydrogenase PreA subunit
MKMKALFIALLFLILSSSLGICRGFCTDVQHHTTGSKNSISATNEDSCSDCGHSKTCCSNNAYSSGAVSLALDLELLRQICQAFAIVDQQDLSLKKLYRMSRGTRAPPFVETITTYSLYQRLQV